MVHSKGFLERNFYSATWGTTFLAAYCHPPCFLSSSLPPLTVTEQTPCRQQECHTSGRLPFFFFWKRREIQGSSPTLFACLSGEYVCVHVQTRASACLYVFSNTYMKFPGRGKKKKAQKFSKGRLFRAACRICIRSQRFFGPVPNDCH